MVQGSTAVLKWKNTTFQFLHAQWVKIYISLIYIYIFISVIYNAYAILRDATIMHRKQSLVILITQTYHCEFYDIGMDNFIYIYVPEWVNMLVYLAISGNHLKNYWWVHNPNLKNSCSFCTKDNAPIMPQFCTCHNCKAVVTCAKLWHDGIIRIEIRANIFLQDFNYKLMKSLQNGPCPQQIKNATSQQQYMPWCQLSQLFNNIV